MDLSIYSGKNGPHQNPINFLTIARSLFFRDNPNEVTFPSTVPPLCRDQSRTGKPGNLLANNEAGGFRNLTK
jgi:hypothetical protein